MKRKAEQERSLAQPNQKRARIGNNAESGNGALRLNQRPVSANVERLVAGFLNVSELFNLNVTSKSCKLFAEQTLAQRKVLCVQSTHLHAVVGHCLSLQELAFSGWCAL